MSHIPLPLHIPASPVINIPHQLYIWLQLMNPHHTSYLPQTHSLYCSSSFWLIHFMSLDVIMTRIHHYGATQSIVTGPENPTFLAYVSFLTAPHPFTTIDPFTVSIVLPPSRMSYSWDHTVCVLFGLASSLSKM